MTPESNVIDDMKYTRTKVTTQIDEDTIRIEHISYTDKLSSTKTEISKTIKTNQYDILKDVISCLESISRKETQRLTIEVTTDRFFAPKLIVKTWVAEQEYHGK
jgi:hypothetical protein